MVSMEQKRACPQPKALRVFLNLQIQGLLPPSLLISPYTAQLENEYGNDCMPIVGQ